MSVNDERLFEMILDAIHDARWLQPRLQPDSKAGCAHLAGLRLRLATIEREVEFRLRLAKLDRLQPERASA